MKTLLIPLLCIVLLGCQSTTRTPKSRMRAGEDEVREELDANPTFIGVVEKGVLQIVFPKSVMSGSTRFTSIAMQEARSPESGELDLSQYEGRAIAIQGHNSGGWVYSARVVDVGGPIVTALVRQVVDQ